MSNIRRYLIVNDQNRVLHEVIHPRGLRPIVVWDEDVSTAMWFANKNEATKYIDRYHINRVQQIIEKIQIEMKSNNYELLADELSKTEDN